MKPAEPMKRVADGTKPEALNEGEWAWIEVERDDPWRGLGARMRGWPKGRFINVWDARAKEPQPENTWAWDGDEENPTLTPSIHYMIEGRNGWESLWHGFLKQGEWRSV